MERAERERRAAVRRERARIRSGLYYHQVRAEGRPLARGFVAEVRRRTAAGETLVVIARALGVGTLKVQLARRAGRCERKSGGRGRRRVDWARLVCRQCGRTFEKPPGEAGRRRPKYCTRVCRDEAQRQVHAASWERRECAWCGKEFRHLKSRSTGRPGRGRCCSRRCGALWAWNNGPRKIGL